MNWLRLFVILSALWLYAFWPREAEAAWVTIGDSITWGFVSQPVGPAYPEMIPGEVVNLAAFGSSTPNWIPGGLYAERLAVVAPGDTVSIMLGTNDASVGLPVASYQTNLAALLTLLPNGVDVILLEPTPNFVNAQAESMLAGYRDALRTLGPDVVAMPLLPEHFATGDLHPNGAGHALIAALLLPEVSLELQMILVLVCIIVVYLALKKGRRCQ